MSLPHNTPAYRSEQSHQLHFHICNCAFDNNHAKAEFRLNRVETYLRSQHDKPAFILETPYDENGNTHGRSHLHDCLYLPFKDQDTSHQPHFKPHLTIALFSILTQFIHHAVKEGKISKQDYSDLLAQPCNNGISLLHEAVLSHNPELARFVFSEVKSHVTPERYAQLLTAHNQEGFTLLDEAVISSNTHLMHFVFDEVKTHAADHYARLLTSANRQAVPLQQHALLSGNIDIVRFIFTETKQVTDPDTFRRLLTHRTKGNWNHFHAAVRYDKQKGTPNPLIVGMLLEEFNEAFGKPQAKPIIQALCSEYNDAGYPVLDHKKDRWLKELLRDYAPILPPQRNHTSSLRSR